MSRPAWPRRHGGRSRGWFGTLLALAAVLAAARGHAAADADPFASPQWPTLRAEMLGDAPAVFDPRVKVVGPAFAEDALNVPIAFDASALGEVDRIVVGVDRNPIRQVLTFTPGRLKPALSFRFKLEQGSPVRVAARTRDGVWHVGGLLVDAAGGGCTVPGVTRKDGSWSATLNRVEARRFAALDGGGGRVRIRVMHPMDTGLVAGIPAFHIEQLALVDGRREPLGTLALHEPVSENPIFSFDLREPAAQPLAVTGRDNNGNRIDARVLP
ncbi:quinoprotein dehydrogenase-associated SoxYZ-like carrier [Cupriavidus gilardii]|uniref:quinoprotein dehydrogenase-associated SoxYZ-like carrier n=1 Tax=Cupriavidus gilardii TaxID=82541 RepID=UPI0009EE6751|nr:quinoprotein dehydrogenase-associated SoxYZ-like carrier [Cupriavidus gilardii]